MSFDGARFGPPANEGPKPWRGRTTSKSMKKIHREPSNIEATPSDGG